MKQKDLEKMAKLSRSKDFNRALKNRVEERKDSLRTRIEKYGSQNTKKQLFRLHVEYPVRYALVTASCDIVCFCDDYIEAIEAQAMFYSHGIDLDIMQYKIYSRPF